MNLIDCAGWFVPVLMGFIVGEILCQSHTHTTGKWQSNLSGWYICLEHSVLYTAAMCLSMYIFCSTSPLNVIMLSAILSGHFIIEKFNITRWWMHHMKMEGSPLYQYYARKLGQEAIDSGDWRKYASTQPDLSMTEYETNASIFYLLEYMVTTRALQFIVTFITVMILSYTDCI
jgi:hypothetical protein